VQYVLAEAETFTREEQQVTLRALGAEATIWREDYAHPDGWPQRYRVRLHFTGFTGQLTILPPARTHDSKNL
jgi:hypothetical protein